MSWIEPLHYPVNPGFGRSVMESIENLLYCGRSYKTVITHVNGVATVDECYNDETTYLHLLKTTAKIVVYCTVVIPLLCLAIKAIYRYNIVIQKLPDPKTIGIEDVQNRLKIVAHDVIYSSDINEKDRRGCLDYIHWLCFFSCSENHEKLKKRIGRSNSPIGRCVEIKPFIHGGNVSVHVHFENFNSWKHYDIAMGSMAGQFLGNYNLAKIQNQLRDFGRIVDTEVYISAACFEAKSRNINEWADRHLNTNPKKLVDLFSKHINRYWNDEEMFVNIVKENPFYIDDKGDEKPLDVDILRKYYDEINDI